MKEKEKKIEDTINKVAAGLPKYFFYAKNLFKKFINSVRIPVLVDFIFKTKQEALDNAPPASENWIRLGLEKTWIYFAILILVLAVYFGKDALIFFINIASYGILLVPLGVIGYWLWKNMK